MLLICSEDESENVAREPLEDDCTYFCIKILSFDLDDPQVAS